LACHTGPLELWIAHEDPQKWLQKVAMFRDLVSEARCQPELRRQLLQKSLVGYLRELRHFCLLEAPIWVCDLPPSAMNRCIVNADGTISPEARRQGLCIGLATDGRVALVSRRDPQRRLVFRLQQGEHRMPATEDGQGDLDEGAEDDDASSSSSSGEEEQDEAADKEGSRPKKDEQGSRRKRVAVAPTGPEFRLELESHPGKALVSLPQFRRQIKGAALAEPLVVGDVAHAVAVRFHRRQIWVASPDMLQHGPTGWKDPWRALFVGDPAREVGRLQAEQLYELADAGDVDDVEALLQQGADPNWPQEYESLGHIACRNGHLGVLDALLRHGLDVNASSEAYEGCALIEAATYGQVACLERLLRVEGLRLDLEEDDKTALQWAQDPAPHSEAREGHAECAKLLAAAAAARG